MSDKHGVTLIELVFALGLSSLALMGVMAISSTMIRHHFHEQGMGAMTGYATTSLGHINRYVENSTYIDIGTPGFPGNNIGGCWNWSDKLAGGVGGAYTSKEPVVAWYFCWKQSDKTLHRYEVVNGGTPCPLSYPGTCGSAVASSIHTVIAKSVIKRDGLPVFGISTAPPNSLAVHYTVGLGSVTALGTSGIAIRVDSTIRFNKSYNLVDQ